MPRKKHIKIAEVKNFSNVFGYKDENVFQNICAYFGHQSGFTLELGCGRGDYTISLAQLHPRKNFIGVDRKPSRIYNGAKHSNEIKVANAGFLVGYAELLAEIFAPASVDEIWITFPDPYPRRSSMKKRLTHPRFLEIYKKILKSGGKVNLKTDDDTLYNYTLKVVNESGLKLLKESSDLYAGGKLTDEEKILTKYEVQHLADGKSIKLVRFAF
ncbi:MAG TPA: tRNA (guanosine(46)-N7)-methyltransferase TrmB [Melioribacteraceae bacterium]|nr:tRNA (guanosine(46)-N7)-methyltransferase TrmB [Melioribacteraceae bacterium]